MSQHPTLVPGFQFHSAVMCKIDPRIWAEYLAHLPGKDVLVIRHVSHHHTMGIWTTSAHMGHVLCLTTSTLRLNTRRTDSRPLPISLPNDGSTTSSVVSS